MSKLFDLVAAKYPGKWPLLLETIRLNGYSQLASQLNQGSRLEPVEPRKLCWLGQYPKVFKAIESSLKVKEELRSSLANLCQRHESGKIIFFSR